MLLSPDIANSSLEGVYKYISEDIRLSAGCCFGRWRSFAFFKLLPMANDVPEATWHC